MGAGLVDELSKAELEAMPITNEAMAGKRKSTVEELECHTTPI